MSKLVLFMPDGTTLEVPLARERTTIGRRADNDICLPNLAVSGEHAAVVTILADSFLEDLGSTNGTLVNSKAIAKHFLRDRDQIDIGRHRLVYCADDAAVIESDAGRTLGIRGAVRGLGDVVEPARPFLRASRDPLLTVNVPDDTPTPVAVASRAQLDPPTAASSGGSLAPPAPLVGASPPGVASIKVLTGVNAGVLMQLTKAQTTIGRPGVQVAAIIRTGELFLLRSIEGGKPLTVNDLPVVGNATVLAPGDIIAIAGTRIEFHAPASAPTEGP